MDPLTQEQEQKLIDFGRRHLTLGRPRLKCHVPPASLIRNVGILPNDIPAFYAPEIVEVGLIDVALHIGGHRVSDVRPAITINGEIVWSAFHGYITPEQRASQQSKGA